MIYTSYFGKCWNYKNAVAISRGKPKNWQGLSEPTLAPATWEMIKNDDWETFTLKFLQQLECLNVHELAKKLNNKILLCWEKHGDAQNCHRAFVREWFIENGYDCVELDSINTTQVANNDNNTNETSYRSENL